MSSVLAVVVALIGVACGTSPARPAPTTSPSARLDPESLAIVGGEGAIGVVSNGTLIEGLKLAGGEGSADASTSLAVVLAGEELAVLRLRDRSVRRRACSGCGSVTAVGDRVVTVGKDFVAQVYDDELKLLATLPLDHVVTPLDAPNPDGFFVPALVGAVNGLFVIEYLDAAGGVRAGPSWLSSYTIEGKLEKHVRVDDVVEGAIPNAAGTQLMIDAGGSGGACAHGSTPSTWDGRGALQDLVPGDEDANGDKLFDLYDAYWNGDQIVTVGTWRADFPCREEPVLREWSPGKPSTWQQIPNDLDGARIVGPGCGTLLVTQGVKPALRLEHAGASRPLPGFNSVLWSAAPAQRCPDIRSRLG